MTIFSKGFQKTSVNAGTVLFTLTSTEEEIKKALRIIYTDSETADMLLGVTLERENIVEEVPLEQVNDLMPERVINLDIEIPIGQTLEAVIKPQTAGANGVLYGFVEYEIMG